MSIELYKEVMILKENPDKKIYLVKSEIDSLFYVKKILKHYDILVYQKLKDLSLIHIPHIIEIHEIDHLCIIIEEYMNYPTLDNYIINYEINRRKAFDIVLQLCDTLEILHQNKIVHRDIKPENIFYDGENIYLFDFDISRIHQKDQAKDTRLLGSYGYAAPEQFGFAQSDARTDIYALGILWNVMLTGKFPQEQIFKGPEMDIIQKAIQIDPLQRYQSITEMKRDLVNHLESSWVIPGFRGKKLITKFVASALYIFLLAVIACSKFENIESWSLLDVVYKFLLLGLFLIIIGFAGNYRKIWRNCILQQSKYQMIRIIGRVLSGILIVFAWILFMSIIIAIVELGLS